MAIKPKKGPVTPQAKGRMATNKRAQMNANNAIVDKLSTQRFVQGGIEGGSGPGRKSIPSPHYWGGNTKRKPNAVEQVNNSAYGSYKNLAKKGK